MSDGVRAASLVAISIACGAAMLWVFRRTADLARVRALGKRIHAHLLAFRIFPDEPALIWRAQIQLLADNVRLLGRLLPAVAAAGLPMAWLMLQLECVYGYAPLRVGAPVVVSLEADSVLAPVVLTAPDGIAIESEPVRIPAEQRVCWRIRPTKPVYGLLRFTIGGVEVTKSIAAGERPVYLSPRRVRSYAELLLHPLEPRLPAGVRSVGLPYDEMPAIRIAGISLPWMIWFLLISAVTALVLAAI